MQVPFVDLPAEYQEIKQEIDTAVNRVLKKAQFILGQELEQFEQEWAKYLSVKFAIGVGNGTDALLMALKILGIGAGDEVIIPSHSFVATAFAVTAAGATPVFADVDPTTHVIDPSQIATKISKQTKAIIPVHLYGNPAPMQEIMALAKTHRLKVIEDAAQAHGATYQGKKAGTFADFGCFSFYPSKNLGAYGDGGAIVTSDADLAKKVRLFRNYGQKQKYASDVLGLNSRLDELQAAVLRVKLRHLDQWNQLRREKALLYRSLFDKQSDLQLPQESNGSKTVYHLFPIMVPKRDQLQTYLGNAGITTQCHYPVPIHQQKVYRNLPSAQVKLPVTEKISAQTLSLPIYPQITDQQIEYVAKNVLKWIKTKAKL